jgi:hypothetical protein
MNLKTKTKISQNLNFVTQSEFGHTKLNFAQRDLCFAKKNQISPNLVEIWRGFVINKFVVFVYVFTSLCKRDLK